MLIVLIVFIDGGCLCKQRLVSECPVVVRHVCVLPEVHVGSTQGRVGRQEIMIEEKQHRLVESRV
jgi:hypothetical protein